MQRIYLIPIIHIPLAGGGFYNVPKYFPHRLNPDASPELAGVYYAWETWLNEDTAIIVADVTDPQHTFVSEQADVVAIPPLDNTIANVADRNRVRNALEVGNVPGNWVQVGMTYRAVVRVVLGMFQFHNRVVAIIQHKLFDDAIDLDMTMAQIPVATRDALALAADDLALDYSWVIAATTVRELLKGMGDQFAGREFQIGSMVI